MKYQSKPVIPVIVDAFIWTGNMHSTFAPPDMALKFHDGTIKDNYNGTLYVKSSDCERIANFGDYIVMDETGNVYPCEPEYFNKNFNLVE